MTYKLGSRSHSELEGVHPDLILVTSQAIAITEQDFTVHDGRRSMEEQIEYVARGVSRTLKSMHLPQPDGFGHAVDLVPYINGKLRWELVPMCTIAVAMRAVAQEEDVPLVWGGFWERLDLMEGSPLLLVQRYMAAKGEDAFVDAAHYEMAL